MVFSMASGSFLGIGVAEIDTAERARALNLKEERGVEITTVQDDGPAAKAGLKTGDVVLEFNGERVEGTEQFVRMVRETPPGRQVKLLVSRGGATQTLSATIGKRQTRAPRDTETFSFTVPRIEIPEIRIPDGPRATVYWRASTLGVEAESLDSQLAEFFGVKEGVLVRSVFKGSVAEKAGVKAGDVIVKVEETRVSTPREVSSAIRTARSRKSLPMVVMRDRKETTLTVNMEDEREGERERVTPRARAINRQL